MASTQEALKEALLERDHHWRSMVETKRKHKAKRKVWEDESSRLLRCLETQTKVTSSHLAAISQQLAPGGSLRASLDAGIAAQNSTTAAWGARKAQSVVSWQSASAANSAMSSPRSAVGAPPESFHFSAALLPSQRPPVPREVRPVSFIQRRYLQN